MGAPRGPEDVDEVEDVRPWARREEVALVGCCCCCWEDAEVEVLPPRAWLPPLPPLLLFGFP